MAESTAKLNILVQLRDEASNAMRSVTNSVSDLGGSFGFAGDKSGILAGALAALGGATVLKAIGSFEEANLKLLTAQALFKTLPDGIQKFNDAIVIGSKYQSKFGFDNESVTLALARLAQATGGDMPHALQALEAAMGLSISKFNGPGGLEQATDLVLRAFTGGGRILKEFGANIGENESAFSAIAKVVEKTTPYLDAWGQSAQKNSEIAKQLGSDILENMGEPLAEAKRRIGELIFGNADLGASIETLKPFWQGLGVSIALVTTYLAIQAIPQLISTAVAFLGIGQAVTIAGAGVLASLGIWALVVLAIAAIITVGILIVKHWDEIKTFLADTWLAIKDKAVVIWESIVNFFKNLPEIIGMIFGYFVVMIVTAFLDLRKFLTITLPQIIGDIVSWFAQLPDRVASAIASLPGRLVSLFQSAAGSIRAVVQDIISFVANAPGSIVDFGKNAINSTVDVLNRFIKGFNSVAGKVGITFPEIPKFAEGGIVNRPTLGLIGEAGPEAVIPLNRLGGGFGASTINVYLQGDFYTTSEIAEEFANKIARLIGYQIKLI